MRCVRASLSTTLLRSGAQAQQAVADSGDVFAISATAARRCAHIALTLWVGVCVVVGGALLVFHLQPLPVPPVQDPQLQAALASTATPAEQGRWRLLHVMYARCPCSNKIIDDLLSSTRPGDVAERVVIVDASDVLRDRLQAGGFIVEAVDAPTLQQRYHLEAAPMLVVADDQGRVRYVGGYTERKQGPVSHDVEIVEQLRRGDRLEGLPLFGCATSRSLQQAVDPLSLRTLLSLSEAK